MNITVAPGGRKNIHFKCWKHTTLTMVQISCTAQAMNWWQLSQNITVSRSTRVLSKMVGTEIQHPMGRDEMVISCYTQLASSTRKKWVGFPWHWKCIAFIAARNKVHSCITVSLKKLTQQSSRRIQHMRAFSNITHKTCSKKGHDKGIMQLSIGSQKHWKHFISYLTCKPSWHHHPSNATGLRVQLPPPEFPSI